MTLRQRNANKDFITPQLFGYDFCKLMIALFLLILVLNCGQSKNKIEGTWTYVKAIENGNEIRSSEKVGNRQFQYLENGEMKLFNDNKRIGLGLYYYKLKGDSLYLTNIQIDTTGKVDTLSTQNGLVSIKNDTMSVKHGDKIYFYKREKTKIYR
jgi:hypothetical protein